MAPRLPPPWPSGGGPAARPAARPARGAHESDGSAAPVATRAGPDAGGRRGGGAYYGGAYAAPAIPPTQRQVSPRLLAGRSHPVSATMTMGGGRPVAAAADLPRRRFFEGGAAHSGDATGGPCPRSPRTLPRDDTSAGLATPCAPLYHGSPRIPLPPASLIEVVERGGGGRRGGEAGGGWSAGLTGRPYPLSQGGAGAGAGWAAMTWGSRAAVTLGERHSPPSLSLQTTRGGRRGVIPSRQANAPEAAVTVGALRPCRVCAIRLPSDVQG